MVSWNSIGLSSKILLGKSNFDNFRRNSMGFMFWKSQFNCSRRLHTLSSSDQIKLAAHKLTFSKKTGLYPIVREKLRGDSVGATSPAVMILSGLSVGCLSYFLTTPLWSAKTRMQSRIANGPQPFVENQPGMFRLIIKDFKESGVTGAWRGATPLVARGGLLTAGQMLGYDFTKSRAKIYGFNEGPAMHFVASAVSALCASVICLPADVLLTRYVSSSRDKSLQSCALELWQERAFFRGWSILFIRMLPTFVLAMPLYEQIRRVLGMDYL